MHANNKRDGRAVRACLSLILVLTLLSIQLPRPALAGAGAPQASSGVSMPARAPLAMATPPADYTFPTFNTGTLTDGGPGHTEALNVSGLPADDYLFFTATADFKLGTPSSAWSDSITMEVNDGGTTVYYAPSLAVEGRVSAEVETTLKWSGVFLASYLGGGGLELVFRDSYNGGGGPYTSSLENVSFSIYPASDPVASFGPFNTGTIVSDTSSDSTALNTASLPATDFLFFTIEADWVPDANPAETSWSYYSQVSISDGASFLYYPDTSPASGSRQDAAPTTLYWSGVFASAYTGGGDLTVTFSDWVSTGYKSTLENVSIHIYAPTTPVATFAPFNTGTIVSETSSDSTALNTASLPAMDFLFFTIEADWVPDANPAETSWSYYSEVAITDGGTTTYFPAQTTRSGSRQDASPTTLFWSGVLARPYSGGGNLTVTFSDDVSSGYKSSLENVVVTIYPAVTAALVRAASDCSAVTKPCSTSLAQAINDVAAGGTVEVVDTLAAEDAVIDKDMVLQSGSPGVLTGAGGAATLGVTSGEVIIQNLTVNAGASSNAVAVSGGTVTLRGNSLDGGGAAAIAQSGGTVSAYANNIVNTGGAGVSGTVSAPKNWWGTAVEASRPGGVSVGDWAVRLGADVAAAAFASGGTVALGNAQLTGPGPGTGVIVSFGSGAANAPFGVGVAPFDAQTCSEYYDFYSTGGAGWTVVLPIDTGTGGCTANVLTPKRAYSINDVSECAAADDAACWDPIPAGQIAINGSNLEISGLSLAGTHIVAGDSSAGGDPTAVEISALRARSDAGSSSLAVVLFLLHLVVAGIVVYAIQAVSARRRLQE